MGKRFWLLFSSFGLTIWWWGIFGLGSVGKQLKLFWGLDFFWTLGWMYRVIENPRWVFAILIKKKNR